MEEKAMTYSATIDKFYRAFQDRDWQQMSDQTPFLADLKPSFVVKSEV